MKAHKLPIYQHKSQILEALKEHAVVIVQSPTGSGKTTQLPIIFHEAGYTEIGMIGVTQPRRIATLGVSDYIAKQLSSPMGEFVGYKMRFEDKTSPRTRLKIMTDGTLLQELKSDPLLSQYSIIMVDEAHERSLNIDFILGLLKQILQKRSDFKIVVSSATINTQTFSRYFHDAPIVTIETSTYPVTVIYDPPISSNEEDLIAKITERVEKVILTDKKTAGDLLIFLPGERAIKLCMQALLQSSIGKKLWILPLYGMLSKEDQERVFLKTPMGKIKVVIATNIAETSITIDGIRTVIDSGLLKENIYNQRTYTNSLVQDLVSQAAADQRKGRAGRTAAGTCYRLYTKEAFKARPAFGTEEIFRTDLSEVVLRMAGLGVGNYLDFDFLNKPSRAGVASGLETLALLGAVDEYHQITSVGQLLLQLPLLPRHGRILVEAMKHYPDVLAECAIACSFLSSNNPQLLPLGEESEARAAHQEFQDPHGDFMGYQKLYQSFVAAEDKSAFCSASYLDLRTMQEIVNVKQQLEEIMHQLGAVIGSGGSVKEYLTCCMAGLVQFICIESDNQMYRSLTTDRIMIHPGSVMFRKKARYILAGEIVRTTRMYARSVSPIEKSWIEELNPSLWQRLKAGEYQARGSEQRERRDGPESREKKPKREENRAKERGLLLGSSLSFLPQKIKGKQQLLLDWSAIWQLAQSEPSFEVVSRLEKGMKANLMLEKKIIFGAISPRFAVSLARHYDPSSSFVKASEYSANYIVNDDASLLLLLKVAYQIGLLCLSKKGDFVGFLTLCYNEAGNFYFKPSRKFSQFLNETQTSLERLDESGLLKSPEAKTMMTELFMKLAGLMEI